MIRRGGKGEESHLLYTDEMHRCIHLQYIKREGGGGYFLYLKKDLKES
jgi:hypothetical protein